MHRFYFLIYEERLFKDRLPYFTFIVMLKFTSFINEIKNTFSLKDSTNPVISQHGHDDVSDNKKGAYTSKHL
ncbi:hypothetical protein LRN_0660 [Ligilactobacillus ruminis DPC 6832]|uniref:Uncharacterized protein n=1 Tax=Ligilactobacillus ruminis DPC 6832 TaxID=1402208 RepID=A0A837DVG3_9LACO|nr:hypothetical protein LRN_0660 [Ligilactobacillus ruminis DPC 6832]